MITVHAQLKDKFGTELGANDVIGHTISAVMAAATAWGRGVLSRTDDPDAYVQYTFTQSKQEVKT